MKMRSKFLALLGATVLSVGVVSVAFAVDLKVPHQGTEVTWDENGDPSTNFDKGLNGEECDGMELGEGEVFFHFVQSPTESDSADLTVDFEDEADWGPTGQDGNQGAQLDWDVSVTDDGDGSVKVLNATTTADGGELKISHICAGTEGGDEPTPTPTFDLETAGITECPCDTIGGAKTSGPADGAWLLVAALGVLLASIVVLTPARAKGRR